MTDDFFLFTLKELEADFAAAAADAAVAAAAAKKEDQEHDAFMTSCFQCEDMGAEAAFADPRQLMQHFSHEMRLLYFLTLKACSKTLPKSYQFEMGQVYTISVNDVMDVYANISNPRFLTHYRLNEKEPWIGMCAKVRRMKSVYIDDNMRFLLVAIRKSPHIYRFSYYKDKNQLIIRIFLA